MTFLFRTNHTQRRFENKKTADLLVLASRKIQNYIESFEIEYIVAKYFEIPCTESNIVGIPESIATENRGIST